MNTLSTAVSMDKNAYCCVQHLNKSIICRWWFQPSPITGLIGTYTPTWKPQSKSLQSKKSPAGPTERTPKPEYLIARSQLTERGSFVRYHSIFDGYKCQRKWNPFKSEESDFPNPNIFTSPSESEWLNLPNFFARSKMFVEHFTPKSLAGVATISLVTCNVVGTLVLEALFDFFWQISALHAAHKKHHLSRAVCFCQMTRGWRYRTRCETRVSINLKIIQQLSPSFLPFNTFLTTSLDVSDFPNY